jgi:trehalose 6-phosphate synthase/phosphatase
MAPNCDRPLTLGDCRWSKDSPWETCGLAADFDWKKTAEPVMRLYTEATDGSYIEHKESAIVWHHNEADPDFGSCQAKELLDHLESVLANEPVVVKRGQHIVEVNPQVSACKLISGCSCSFRFN